MRKTVTIAAYNRPDNVRMLIDSLRGQMADWGEWEIYIRIDAGGDQFAQVVDETRRIDFCPYRVFWPKQNEGINLNTYWLMHHVYENLNADYNLYLEDDLLLSPDALSLCNWYIEHERELLSVDGVADIGALCLCKLVSKFGSENLPQGEQELFLSRAFVGWGFLMGQRQWWAYGNPSWCTAAILWGRTMMWDNSVAGYIRSRGERIYNLFSALSRATNTGREGVHFTSEIYDRMMAEHVYQQERKEFDYYLTGAEWVSSAR